ncbi:ABC transporter permease [Frigoribacterium sp. UYMn621]|uniref:ABC transporter permease n=1 Tax=Frigoribacterium sp. UYMn621 TaxID=3156343 RepID=UPI003393B0C4
MAKPTFTESIGVVAPTSTELSTGARVIKFVADRGIIAFTVILIVYAAIFVNGFASLPNISDVFYRAAPIGIVALGMTFVVISANYLDLSVVAQVATSAVIFIGVSNQAGLAPAILLALLVAVIYGVVNGVAVGFFHANAVIVTLATTFVGLGVLRWLSGGSIFFGPNGGVIQSLGQAKVGPIPLSAIVLIVMAVILGFVLQKTTFGFSIRSYGSNKAATRLAGVRTGQLVVGAFLITSISAMVAGFVLAAFSNTAVSSMAEGYDFQALAAIIIGGTSVFGGKGSVYRTLLGVVFVSVLTNILVLVGLTFGAQQVAIGVLIVVAVSIDAIARKLVKN